MEWLYAKAIPIEAQYLYRKAMELSQQGQTGMALNYYKQAVVIAPRYSQAYYEMGNCLARLGHVPGSHRKIPAGNSYRPGIPGTTGKNGRAHFS